MQDQRKILRHLRAEHQAGLAGNLDAGFKAAKAAVDEVDQANAAAHGIGDRLVGRRHGLQAIDQPLLDDGFGNRAIAGQAEADHRLDHREQILDAVMQFGRQKILVLLGLLLEVDAGDEQVKVRLMKTISKTATVASKT